MKRTEYVNIGAKDVVITGNIKATVDIAIAATVIGNIECTKKVIIDDQAVVSGDITASDLIVLSGHIDGNVSCSNSVQVYRESSIEGNVVCRVITIEEGAMFEGECSTNTKEMSE